jgi:3'(2'), 5'-bisphosphate nucleotidase
LLLRIPLQGQPPYRLKIWDYAAGSILVEEAGGVTGDLNGRSLDFGRGRDLSVNYGILVSTEKLYPRVLETLQQMQISDPDKR